MKKATVTIPFTTDKNEICLIGDTIHIDGKNIYFKHHYLGHLVNGKIEDFVLIEKEW